MKKERFVNAMLPALASTVTLETASAYAHSTAIFAECWNSSGLLIDQPWIEPQDLQQTPESIKRWSDENMGERYFFLLDDWIRLSEKGFLPGGVSSIFFRYLNYSILDRLAVHVASEVLSGAPIDDRLIAHWSRLENVVNLLSDEEQRKRHRQWLKSLGVILTEFVASRSNFARLKASLEQHIILTANDHQFPFSVITGDLE
jgi:hypothetical protein